jgi:hypothetical protein
LDQAGKSLELRPSSSEREVENALLFECRPSSANEEDQNQRDDYERRVSRCSGNPKEDTVRFGKGLTGQFATFYRR